MNKLVVILGPTASGKTDLSIKLAKKYNGEIISADSRQVYKGLDIGSGKITKKEMQEIPHYLLDVANPKRKFSVAQYQKLALKAIKSIQKKNKLPILVGGTGFYIQSIVDGIVIPEVKPNWELRKELEKKSNEQLYQILLKKDPRRAESIDKNNPHRLIRALEIVLTTGKPVPALLSTVIPAKAGIQSVGTNNDVDSRFRGNDNILQIGIKITEDQLKKNIKKRLLKRLKNNAMINEVKKLHKTLSWKRLEEFGLEYRFVAQYLQDKISYQEMIDKIQIESEHYTKRQMTWFSAHGGSASGGKREPPTPTGFGGPSKKIHWVKSLKEADKLTKKFLQQKTSA